MGVNFKDLLSVNASTVEKPKPVPVGTYSGTIVSHEFGESQQKKTPYARIHVQLNSPGADVDTAQFEASGGLAGLAKRKFKVDYYLTAEALYRLKDFFSQTLGLEVEGKTFDELCPQMNGQPVVVEISHQPSADGQEIYANIARMIKA